MNDHDIKKDLLQRLRRVEGQVRGLQRMVEEERLCGDVLDQLAAVQSALRSVGRLMARRHIETCLTDALRSGDAADAEHAYDELMKLLARNPG